MNTVGQRVDGGAPGRVDNARLCVERSKGIHNEFGEKAIWMWNRRPHVRNALAEQAGSMRTRLSLMALQLWNPMPNNVYPPPLDWDCVRCVWQPNKLVPTKSHLRSLNFHTFIVQKTYNEEKNAQKIREKRNNNKKHKEIEWKRAAGSAHQPNITLLKI